MPLSEIIYQVIFYAFAVLVVGSAVIVAFARNIVHSAFALLLTLFGVAGLYVFLAADFLAGAQLMVYVGGILVLILFAVMLTSKITDVHLSNPATSPIIGGLISLTILAGLLYVIFQTNWPVVMPKDKDIYTIAQIGRELMGKYLLVFEVVGVLLLAVLIGAAYLARPSNKEE